MGTNTPSKYCALASRYRVGPALLRVAGGVIVLVGALFLVGVL